jgi:uncharacterized protein (TIGR03435 family)
VLALLAALVCGGPVGAQTVTSTLAANTATRGFEVATIRPANGQDGRHWYGSRLSPSGRFEVSAMTLEGIAWRAYIGDVTTSRMSGGPKWASSDSFDITAKLDDADMAGWDKLTQKEQYEIARAALRKLLEERFQLKLHTETHVEPVYALVQVKSGAKLKEVPAPEPETPEQGEQRTRDHPKSPPPGGFMMSGDEWIATGVPISGLLGQISHEFKLDHPLIDETGLKGYYAFDIKRPHEQDGPTLADLIEQQMGLRVESRKVPITVYVIDAAEKPSLDGAEQ